MVIIKGHRPIAEAYAANALDIYDHYAWRWWLAHDPQHTWTSLKPNDSWQNSYFDQNSRPISPELNFWLAASPSADALPTPNAAPQARPETAVRKLLQPASAGAARAPRNRPRRESTVSYAGQAER
jgi:hypothetical protein